MQQDLVERAKRGDHEAFDALASNAFDGLYALARRILRDADRTDDAVQQCLVNAWRDLPGLRDTARFDAWLHLLLVNACYDESRHQRRRSMEIHVLPLDRAGGRDAANDLADRDELERGFKACPIEQRAVLVMYVIAIDGSTELITVDSSAPLDAENPSAASWQPVLNPDSPLDWAPLASPLASPSP